MFTKVVRFKPDIVPLMFSGQFDEKRLSVREKNTKLLLETVTYIAIMESHPHNCNGYSHVHNALQKMPPA